MDTGICYIIDENGYIMFISQHEGIDRLVGRNEKRSDNEEICFISRTISANLLVNLKDL